MSWLGGHPPPPAGVDCSLERSLQHPLHLKSPPALEINEKIIRNYRIISPPSAPPPPPPLCVASLDSCNATLAALLAANRSGIPDEGQQLSRRGSTAVGRIPRPCGQRWSRSRRLRFSLNRSSLRPKGVAPPTHQPPGTQRPSPSLKHSGSSSSWSDCRGRTGSF